MKKNSAGSAAWTHDQLILLLVSSDENFDQQLVRRELSCRTED